MQKGRKTKERRGKRWRMERKTGEKKKEEQRIMIRNKKEKGNNRKRKGIKMQRNRSLLMAVSETDDRTEV